MNPPAPHTSARFKSPPRCRNSWFDLLMKEIADFVSMITKSAAAAGVLLDVMAHVCTLKLVSLLELRPVLVFEDRAFTLSSNVRTDHIIWRSLSGAMKSFAVGRNPVRYEKDNRGLAKPKSKSDR